MKNLKKIARVPVALAILGAYLNSAELLAQFQPEGREWVGWLGALSVSVALFLCTEAFLRQPTWVNALAVVGFGLAEVSGQVLHAALIRDDVVFMTDLLRWLMAYISPSLVVVVGVVTAFVAHYGFVAPTSQGKSVSMDVDALTNNIAILSNAINQQTFASRAHKKNTNGAKKTNGDVIQLPLLSQVRAGDAHE